MRLWSIHPQYLDSLGPVAPWREALLAQAVLCSRVGSRPGKIRRRRGPGEALTGTGRQPGSKPSGRRHSE